jgi:predicted secreted hydrolase
LPRRRPTAFLLGIFVAAALLAACGGDAVPEPLVAFPQDEGPHATPIEWWYFNGLLTDDQGNEYSYHYVTFQSEAVETAVPHLLQASLGDHTRTVHLTGEKAVVSQVEPDAGGVDVNIAGWEMRGDGTTYDMKFNLDGYALDLQATSKRRPVLHEGDGLVHLGPAGNTFYYSRTRLDVSGFIKAGPAAAGTLRPVTGTSWMDHQWGEVSGQLVGWDWTSIQLDDGTDLMAVELWDPDGHQQFARYGTFVFADATVRHLLEDDISITASDSWASPETGVVYPLVWRVEVNSLDLALDLTPVLENAEFASSEFINAAYWEGEVTVSGTRNGNGVSGRGFVELVGYDPRQLEAPVSPQSRR